MGQIRKMFSQTTIDDSNITVVTTFQNQELSGTVARGGSEDTDFATLLNAHKSACKGAPPASTTAPIAVPRGGYLIHSVIDSGTITVSGTSVRMTVPVGNTGSLKFHIFHNDGTAQYQKNGGSWTTFVDGDTLAVADGDMINVQATGLASGGSLSGNITDTFTSLVVDTFQMSNPSF